MSTTSLAILCFLIGVIAGSIAGLIALRRADHMLAEARQHLSDSRTLLDACGELLS